MNMTDQSKAVPVMRIPEISSALQRSIFLGDFQNHVDVIRPSIVLDCSDVRRMDKSTLLLLIECLEEAMKRNGDLRLASVCSQGKAILKGNGMGGIFQCF